MGFALVVFWGGGAFAQMSESFEFGVPPPGWIKTNLLGGSGWYQLPIGVAPLPGWGNGTSSVPATANSGIHNAYCTWSTGGGAAEGYHSDQWLISPRLTGLTATSTVSYWLRFNFTNYPDEVRFRVSTNGPAPANFTFVASTNIFAKASYTNQFPPWSNHVVNVGALGIPAGTPIWIAIQEYVWDNTWNGAAIQLDVINSDLTAPPAARVSPTSVTFTAYYEGSNPAAQTFTLQSVGSSGLGYASGLSFGAGPTNWLTVTGPASGTLGFQQSQSFSASVAVAGLDLGTYVATNVFNVPGATNNPLRVPITLNVIRRPQTISFPNPGPQYTTNKVGLAGTASSGLPVTFSIFSGPGTVVGATNLSFTGTGTVKVVAWQLGNVYYDVAPCVTQAMAVTKPNAAILYTNLSHVYDGSPHGATVTTVPAGLTVDTTYNGSASLPVAIGTYAVTSTVNDAIYAGTATATFTITRMVQTVTFPDPGAQWTTSVVGLAATASSGLPVAFSVASGPGSIAGGTNLTFTGAGTVSVVAAQAGDADWLPASATNSIAVTKALATVTLGSLSQTYDGSAKSATATTVPAGLAVDFTYDGSAPAPTAAGSYAVTGTVNEAMYQGTDVGTLTIGKGAAMVTLENLVQEYDGTTKPATATTVPPGLAVDFTYDGATNWPVAVGSYAVTGTVNEANWQGSATGTLAIGKGTATVTLGNLEQEYDGTARPATATTDPTGLTVDFTYDGETNWPVAVGSYAVTGRVNEANWQGSGAGTLTIGKGTATIALDDLSHVYDGTEKNATATTVPTGLVVDLTYDGDTNRPVEVGSYAVTGTVNEANWQGTNAGTLVIAKIPATVALSDLSHVYDGTAKSATATTDPVGLTVDLTYDGSATAPTAAGNYAVTGAVNEAHYQGVATGTLVIAKLPATVTLNNLLHVYDGSAKSAAATTDPIGLAVEFTYDGSATAPMAAGSYAVTGTISDAIYQGTDAGTLVIAKGVATVGLTNLSQAYDGTPRNAAATTVPVGLAVEFTYDGSTNAPTARSSYAVTGTVDDVNWQGAATGLLLIDMGAAAVSLESLSQAYDGTPKHATATTVPVGLAVEFTYDGETNGPVEVGSYAVTGTVNDADWAGSSTGTLAIGKGTVTITLGGLAHVYDGTAKPATATTVPTGLVVDLTYDGETNLPVEVGSYAVTGTVNEANWQGTNIGTLVIAKIPATVALDDLSHAYDGTAKSATATTDPAGLTVDLTYDGSATAPTAAGSYAVTGAVNEANYEGSATGTLVIAKASATVVLTNLLHVFDGTAKSAAATTDPIGLAVELTYDGSVTAPTAAGSYAVTGTINDAMYEGADVGTLAIAKGTATVALGGLAQAYDGTPKPATATTVPAGLAVDFTYNGETNEPIAVGSYAVTGTVNEANWQGSATGTLAIGKGTATVALGNLAQAYDGTPKHASATTVPAGLAVEFTYDGATNGPVAVGSYAVTGTVNDADWVGSSTGTLMIGKGAATVMLGDLSQTYDGTARIATATTDPAGLTVDFTYDGSATPPTEVGNYAVTGVVADATYQGSAAGTLVVAKGNQTILDFLPPDGARFELGATTSLSAQASSGLTPVTFSNLTPAIASLVGNDIAFTNRGRVRVQAYQAGNASWNAVSIIHEWRVGGLITNVVPGVANVGGGIEVLIQGVALGNGADIAEVTLAGVAATIVTQSMDEVRVWVEPAPAATTGDVVVVSGTGNTMVLGNGFEYLWLDAPNPLDPSEIRLTSLLARWQTTPGATAHLLDVAYDTNFTDYVPGYEGLDVGLAEELRVTGLDSDTGYALRLYAWNSNGFSLPSRTVWAFTAAPATVSLTNLLHVYDGTPKSASATTDPAGLAVDFTYDGSPTAPTAVGSYAVTGMVNEAGYEGSAVGTLTIDPSPFPDKINCGGLALAGGWLADTGFVGGAAGQANSSVANATNAPMAVYQTERNANAFRYNLSTVPNGACRVRLHFSEMAAQSDGARVFNVAAEGTPRIANLDVFAAAGGRLRALTRTFDVAVSDGNGLQLDFTGVVNHPEVNGIEVESVGPRQPYPFGAPWALPGLVEMENFDVGGPGVAYNDTTAENEGGWYRLAGGVGVARDAGAGNGYVVGWTKAGEWMEFTVNVGEAGTYVLETRVAGAGAGGQFRILVNGADQTGALNVPNTGAWNAYQVVRKTGVALSSGIQTVRVEMVAAGTSGHVGAFDWFRVVASRSPYPSGTPWALPGLVEMENFDIGGQGVAYNDIADVNEGGRYRPVEGVGIAQDAGAGNGYVVGWTRAGEWMEYTVDVGAAGTYALETRVAGAGSGGQFRILINGADQTGVLNVPNTGAWNAYQIVRKTGVALSSGVQTVRVEMVTAGTSGSVGAFDWFRVVAPPVRSAYPSGTPWALPGLVEMENFDIGGPDVAYGDGTAANEGGQYRLAEGVDIAQDAGAGNGYVVGWTKAGEWMEFTVNVGAAGTYALETRVAGAGTGGQFRILINGADQTGVLDVPNTGAWNAYQVVQKTGVALLPGIQTVRVEMVRNGSSGYVGAFDWFRVQPGAGRAKNAVDSTAGHLAALMDVRTSQEGPQPGAGWLAMDGDPESTWRALGRAGSWICLSYDRPVAVRQVEVEFTEDSPTGLRLLASQDAIEWFDFDAQSESGAVEVNYLWFIFPAAPLDDPPAVREIEVYSLPAR